MVVSGLVGAEVVLQNGVNIDVSPEEGLAGSAVSAFLTTLIVGALLVTFAETYTERMMTAVGEDPVGSLVYGFISLFLLVVLVIILVITILGILLAIPLIILAVLVWAVGATIVFLAVADRFVSREDGWLKPLVLAALFNGVLALSGIGGVISFFAGALGFGAVLRDRFF